MNIQAILSYFRIDFWTGWGFAAQALFLSSFIVQWLKSEKAKKSLLPAEFWYLRLAGGLMLLVYVIVRKDLVFAVALVLQTIIYLRNIWFGKRHEKEQNENRRKEEL